MDYSTVIDGVTYPEISIPFEGLEIPIRQIVKNTLYATTGQVFHEGVDGSFTLIESPKFIIANKEVTRLSLTSDNWWEDDYGVAFALRRDNSFIDKDPRAGVGVFSLPDTPYFQKINDAARHHDARYDMPFYVAYHTELEADSAFNSDLKTLGVFTPVRDVLYFIVRQLGWWWYPKKK